MCLWRCAGSLVACLNPWPCSCCGRSRSCTGCGLVRSSRRGRGCRSRPWPSAYLAGQEPSFGCSSAVVVVVVGSTSARGRGPWFWRLRRGSSCRRWLGLAGGCTRRGSRRCSGRSVVLLFFVLQHLVHLVDEHTAKAFGTSFHSRIDLRIPHRSCSIIHGSGWSSIGRARRREYGSSGAHAIYANAFLCKFGFEPHHLFLHSPDLFAFCFEPFFLRLVVLDELQQELLLLALGFGL